MLSTYIKIYSPVLSCLSCLSCFVCLDCLGFLFVFVLLVLIVLFVLCCLSVGKMPDVSCCDLVCLVCIVFFYLSCLYCFPCKKTVLKPVIIGEPVGDNCLGLIIIVFFVFCYYNDWILYVPPLPPILLSTFSLLYLYISTYIKKHQ